MPIYQNNVPFQRQYIGARYVPKFYEGSHGAEWEDNAQYEPLTIVTYLANSYCSKKFVPALVGNPTITPEYWVCISNFNAQVASLEQDIEDVDAKVGNLADLQTTDKRSIVNAINEANASGGSAETKIGNLNALTTTEKSTVVGAINEVDNNVATAIANIGNLLNLTTEAKNNLVNAVNEVNGSIVTVNNKVGNLSNLNTTEKSNVVGAINEVVGEIGNLSSLETTYKNDLVGAINEANSSGGSADTKIGDLTDLDTTYKTNVVGAINEVLGDVDKLNNYVTPQMFGAKGNNIDDDTTAINNAITYCNANKKPLFFPDCAGYYITTGIEILDLHFDIIMDGDIRYDGSNYALKIATVSNQNLRLRVRSDLVTIPETSIGVWIGGGASNNIEVQYVANFNTGLCLKGETGILNNTFTLGYINNCRVSVLIDSVNTGYCNENLFLGGYLRVDTNMDFASTFTGIKITKHGTHTNDCNHFIKPCIEGALYSVDVEYGRLNTFESVRVEGASNAMRVQNNAKQNKMTISWFSGNTTFLLDETTDAWSVFNSVECNYVPNYKTLYHSGGLKNLIRSNASDCCIIDNSLCGVSNDGEGNPKYGLVKGVTRTTNGFKGDTRGMIGIMVDTREIKKFIVSASANTASYAYKCIAIPYDSNDNQITTGVKGTINTYGTFNGINVFYSGDTYTNHGFEITVPDNCVRCFLGISCRDDVIYNSLTVYGLFKTKTDEEYGTGIIDMNDEKGLYNIPTNDANVGDYCANLDASVTGLKGWYYNGTQWVADYVNSNAPI